MDNPERPRHFATPSRAGQPVYSSYPDPQQASRFTLDRVIRILLRTALLAAVVWLLWYFSGLILYLLIGVVLAYIMKPLVDRLQGLGLGRIPSILVAFVVVFGGLGLLVTQLAPFASRQISGIADQISFQEGMRINAVAPDSPAERAGLVEGDIILAIDDSEWEGFSQLQSLMHAREPGDSLRLMVENRDGDRVVRMLVVGVPSRTADAAAVAAEGEYERFVESLGVTAEEVTLSNVAKAIERRVRTVLPIERGAITRGSAEALNNFMGEERIATIAGSVVGVFTNIFYAVLVIPFVAFFFLKDGSVIRRSLLRLVPNRYFELTLALTEKIETNIGRYFRGLLLQVLAVAIVATLLLWIVGLEYAIAVGAFTGLANTIPYFGPLMGFIAGTLVGVVQTGDFSLVFGVVIAMLLTQMSDNVIFQPYIFSRAARTHPLLILFAVLIGAQIAGIIGMLLAIPVMTIIRVTVEELLWSLRNYRILKAS